MVKKDQDLEEEWKRLRGKIQFNLKEKLDEGLVEDVKDEELQIRSEQFTEFLGGETGFKVPVLEKVERPKEQEQSANLEELDLPEMISNEPKQPTPIANQNQPVYIADTENFYQQISQTSAPPIMRARDTMPVEQIPEHELFSRTSSMAGVGVRESVYPEVLESEQQKEEGERYYKLTK